MTDVVIAGAGGFGAEVYQYVLDLAARGQALRVVGALDDGRRDTGFGAGTVPFLGSIDAYAGKAGQSCVVAVGDAFQRRAVAERLAARGGQLLSVVHPSAYVAPTARLGAGCVICPFAFVGPEAQVGANVVVNVYGSVGHHATVGAHSVLSPYATVHGYAVLEDAVFLGSHASVTARKRVGTQSKVAAGAAVYRDVPPRSLASGNPARAREIYTDDTR